MMRDMFENIKKSRTQFDSFKQTVRGFESTDVMEGMESMGRFHKLIAHLVSDLEKNRVSYVAIMNYPLISSFACILTYQVNGQGYMIMYHSTILPNSSERCDVLVIPVLDMTAIMFAGLLPQIPKKFSNQFFKLVGTMEERFKLTEPLFNTSDKGSGVERTEVAVGSKEVEELRKKHSMDGNNIFKDFIDKKY